MHDNKYFIIPLLFIHTHASELWYNALTKLCVIFTILLHVGSSFIIVNAHFTFLGTHAYIIFSLLLKYVKFWVQFYLYNYNSSYMNTELYGYIINFSLKFIIKTGLNIISINHSYYFYCFLSFVYLKWVYKRENICWHRT